MPSRLSQRAQEDKPFVELEASLERTGRIEELIRLYESRARETHAPVEAARLLGKAADLARSKVKDLLRAEGLLRQALLLAPDERDHLRALRLLYEQTQEHGGLAEVLERLAASSTGAESARTYLEAAEVWDARLRRPERAVLCCQLAAKAEPREREAYRRARQLQLQDGRHAAALDTLDRERAALGGAGLADEYAALAEAVVDDPQEHPVARRAIEAALALEPNHAAALRAKELLERLPSSWAERVRALRASSFEERDRKLAARKSLKVAKLLAAYDPPSDGKIKEAVDRCLLLWPGMPDAVTFLERQADREDRLPEAIARLERLAAEHSERGTRVELLLRAGSLRLSRLNDPQAALAAFEKAAAMDPARADASSLAFELLLEQDRVNEAASLLERHLATVRDRSTQIELRTRLARLYQQAGDAAAARGHLEAILALDSTQLDAAFGLASLLLSAGELDGLPRLLQGAADARRPEAERLSLLTEIAALASRRGDDRLAADALGRALLLEPSRVDLLEVAVPKARSAGLEAELAPRLRRAAEAAPEPAAVALWRVLAQILVDPLARPAEAQAAWEEVLTRAPADPEASAALETARRVTAPAALDRRAQLEAELARVAGPLADPNAVAAVCRELLAIAPDHLGALKQLGGASAALGQWAEVARVTRTLAEVSRDPGERNEWRARLAQLHADRLGKKDEAARLFLELLAEGHDSVTVVRGLERLASAGIRRDEISRALVPHYARSGDHQRAAATLLLQLSAARSLGEQKQLLRQLAELQENRLADGRAAFALWLRAVAADPTDPSLRNEAMRLARDLLAHAELATAFIDVAARRRHEPVALALLREAALVAEEGGAVDGAERALRAGLELSPLEPELLERLVRLQVAAGRLTDAERTLRQAVEAAPPKLRPTFLLQLAGVYDQLASPRAAAGALEEAIRAGAEEAPLLERLCDLLERSAQPQKLASALERLAAAADAARDPERASAARVRRGHVLESSLGDRAAAVRTYADVLAKRPSDPEAIASLEALLEDPACREDAARTLLPAYRALGDHQKVLAALEVIANAAQDGQERVQALRQAAQVYFAQLKQPDLAFAALARALRFAPHDATLRRAARLAAESCESLDTYAEVLAELLDEVPPAAQGPLHLELAELKEKESDRAAAIRHLRAASALDPQNVDILKALQRLHRAGDEWASLAEVTERLAAALGDPALQLSAWREAAALHEQRLWDKESALACCRQIAARAPLDKEAAAAIDRLATELGRPQDLAFALELERAQEAGGPRWRDLSVRLAVLKEEKLGDAAGAVELCSEVLAQDSSHTAAREALLAWAETGGPVATAALALLDPMLARAGDHERRVSLRELRLANAPDEEKGPIALELLRICEAELGQSERAFMLGLKAFAAGVDRDRLAPVLERLAAETDALEELAEVFEAAVDELLPGDERIPPLLRRAAGLRERLSQNDAAIRLWNELLAEVPGDALALEKLAGLYERTKSARELSAVYARRAELTTDPAERAELLLRSAAVSEESGQEEAALEQYRAALELRPDSRELLLGLERLLGRARRTAEQLEILGRLTAAAKGKERQGFLLRRGRLLEREGRGPEALSAYAEALAAAPAEAELVGGLERLLERDDVREGAVRLLEPIYRERQDARRLAELLELRLEQAPEALRPDLLRELAALRESLGEGAMAFVARVKAFTARPADEAIRRELERSAQATGSMEELVGAYEDLLERRADDALAAVLWRRLAELHAGPLNRADLAARAWEEVLRRESASPEALRSLAEAYRRAGAFKQLVETMLRQVALEPSVDAQVNLLYEAAQLAEEGLGDKALAAGCYQKVLERAPKDRGALKSLETLLAESRRHAELAAILEREISLAHEAGAQDVVIELRLRLARLKLSRLSDAPGAMALVEQVLSERPGHGPAIELLEELSRAEGQVREQALRALEPLLEGAGGQVKLIELLEAQAAASDSPEERAAGQRRIAGLHQARGDPEVAFLAAARAMRELPGDAANLELCVSLAGLADMQEELADLLAEVAPSAPAGQQRAAAFRALARLRQQTGEGAEAVAAWEEVLEAAPEDEEALSCLEPLFTEQGRIGELLLLLSRRLRRVEGADERYALLLRIASAHERAGADAEAVEPLREAFALKGTAAPLEALDRVLGRLGRDEEQAEVLARLSELDRDFEAGRRHAVARADALARAGKIDAAIAAYEQVLGKAPADAGAVAGLERLIESPAKAKVVRLLDGAYRAQGDARKRAAALELRLELALPSEAPALMRELASMRESLGEHGQAFPLRRRLFAEAPDDEQARADLERVAEAAGALEELVAAYEDQLDRGGSDALVATLWRRVAGLRGRLRQPALALEAWEEVARREPKNPEPLRALAEIYREASNHEHLTRVLHQLVEVEPSVDAQVDLLFELAQIAEDTLADRALAADSYREVLRRQPKDRTALKSLHAVLAASGQHSELAEVLASEIALAREGGAVEEVVDLELSLARLKLHELGDRAGALELFSKALPSGARSAALAGLEEIALSSGPLRDRAAELIEPILEAQGEEARLVQILEAHASATESPSARAALRLRAAELCAGALDDAAAAFLHAGRALRDTPDEAGPLEECLKLSGRADAADELCALLEEVAPLATSPVSRVRLHRALAKAQEAAGEGESAVGGWRKVLEDLPSDAEALERLEALLWDQGRHAELVELLRGRLALAEEGPRRVSLLTRIAKAQEAMGEDGAAVESLRAAFALGQSLEVLSSLDRILGRAGRLLEQAEVLQKLAELTPDPIGRKGHLVRRGEVLAAGGAAELSVEAFAEALSLSPADPAAVAGLEALLTAPAARHQAASLLEPIYRSRGDDRALVGALDVQLLGAAPEARRRLLKEIARLRDGLSEPAMAFAATLTAFAEAPEDSENRRELERLAAASGSEGELADALRAELERAPDGPLALELWRKLALLYQGKLARADLAAQAWEELLRREDGDRDALRALSQLYREARSDAQLATVLERQVAVEPAVEGQVALLLELAQLADERLHDKAAAARYCREVIQRRPEHSDAAELLASLLLEASRFSELAELLDERIAFAARRGEPTIELRVRLAAVKARNLEDGAGALALLEPLLEESPGHEGAVGVLEDLMRSGGQARAGAAALLQPIFAGTGQNEKLVEALEARLTGAKEAKERLALLKRISELYSGPLWNAPAAYDAAARALREAPADGATLQRCLELAEPASRKRELAALLGEIAPLAAGPARGELFSVLARLLEEQGRPAEAIEGWRAVLDARPDDPDALDSAARLLEREGRFTELLEMLERKLALATTNDARGALLLKMGLLQDEALHDDAAALATFRHLAELRPKDAIALERMDRLCQTLELWPELEGVLERRAEAAPPAERLELELRLADLRDERLGNRLGAVQLYADILSRDPGHPGALARMEAIAAAEPSRTMVADILLRAYRTTGSHEKLAALLEVRAGQAKDAGERKALLLELAAVRADVQEEPELAFLAVLRAFRDDPSDREVRAQLQRVADAAGTHDGLADAFEQALPSVKGGKAAAELCLALAAVVDERLDEPERAVGFYAKARGLDRDADPVALPALERLLHRLRRWEELASVLEEQVVRATDPLIKIGLLSRLGQLAEEWLESPARAVGYHEQVLQIDPKNLEAARILERLYEATGNAARLLDVLTQQRQLLHGAEREAVTLKMAQVCGGPLEDVDRAIALCRELLSDNPRNEGAFATLEGLLEGAGRSAELEEMIKARLLRTLDPRELLRLHLKLARVVWRLRGRPEDAVGHCRSALERDGRNVEALTVLAELLEELDRPAELIDVLRRLIPQLEAAPLDSRPRLRAARLGLAELCAEAERHPEALESARRALLEAPTAEELPRLRQVFLTLQAFPDAARARRLEADALLERGEVDAAVAGLFEVAELEGRGPRPLDGASALEKILELRPEERAAYDALRALYSAHGEWPGFARLVSRFFPHLGTEEERFEALRLLAEAQAERLSDKGAAFVTLCTALGLRPGDAKLVERLEGLAAEVGAQAQLADALSKAAESLPRGEQAARVYLRLAALADGPLDDVKRARAALERVLEFDPVNAAALEALAAMLARRGQHREYVAALEQKREVAKTPAERMAILREIARIHEAHLADPRGAASALRRALDLEVDPETVRALVALHRRHQQWEEAVEALRLARDRSDAPEERALLQLEIARLQEDDAKDDAAAAGSFLRVLELDLARTEAFTALERILTRLERHSELIKVYERRIELAVGREKVELLFKCAALWEERLGNPIRADACMEAVLSLEPQNLAAIGALERLRREHRRWPELVAALQHHAEATPDPDDQAELWVQIGEVQRQELRALDQAAESYRYALGLNPRSLSAVRALSSLHERRAEWPQALEMLQREAALVGPTPAAADLYARAGKIYAVMLFDSGRAKQAFLQARRIDPGHLGAIRSLRTIHEQERDWSAYEKTLLDEAQYATDPSEKAAALLDAARHAHDRKGGAELAGRYYEEALKLSPGALDAARPLAEMAIARGEWPAAARLLETVTARLAERLEAQKPVSKEAQLELAKELHRLGQALHRAGERDRAADAYQRALKLDPSLLPVREELASLLVDAGRLEEALAAYDGLVSRHRAELSEMGVVGLLCRMGELHLKLGQPEKAQGQYERALAIAPSHGPALGALSLLSERAGRFRQAADLKQRLALVLDGEARYQACVELGALAREKLSDSVLAIDAYVRALKVKPDSLPALEALESAYREARQLTKAARTLEAIAAHPEVRSDAERRKRALKALGDLAGTELGEVDRAVAAYDEALDADPRFAEAFAGLEALLRAHRRWPALEASYLRMIERLGSGRETLPARLALWRSLGDLRATELAHPDGALEAYQHAAAGLPDDAALQENLGRLAAQAPGREEVAVAAYRRALSGTERPAQVVSALAALFARRSEYDGAYLAAKLMEGLVGEVGPGEQEILGKLEPFAKQRDIAKLALTDRLWEGHLRHPRLRGPLCEMMSVLFEYSGQHFAASHSDHKVHPKKHRLDPAAMRGHPVLRHVRYVTRLLDTNVEVYSPYLVVSSEPSRKPVQPPDLTVGVELCQTDPPCLKLGGRFFSSGDAKETYSLLAFAVALARPELAFARRLPLEQLDPLFQAAISLTTDRFRFTADPKELKRDRKLLEKSLPEPARVALDTVVRKYLTEGPKPGDLAGYLQAAELTAVRAALLVAGEPLAVRRTLLEGRGVLAHVTPAAAARELLVFGVSGDWAALRAAVEMDVQVVPS